MSPLLRAKFTLNLIGLSFIPMSEIWDAQKDEGL